MIARIKGTVLETTPLLVVIEAGGVGYDIQIPITTAEKVPGIGKECSLFIHSVYREDSASLYGFATREDRDFFRLLVEKVSGIGPKIGIAILSRMSVELLRGAIASADIGLLSKCPGIGKKTAERLVIELKDKVSLSAAATTADATGSTSSAKPERLSRCSQQSYYSRLQACRCRQIRAQGLQSTAGEYECRSARQTSTVVKHVANLEGNAPSFPCTCRAQWKRRSVSLPKGE